MGQFTYRPAGQDLLLSAGSGTIYSDAAYVSPVTVPSVLPRVDPTYYVPDGVVRLVLNQLDGTSVYDETIDVRAVGSPA